jgi:CRISPR-associated protein Cmr4
MSQLFFLQALSPLHIGVGEGVGHINLPTAREITTQYPYVPGSSIKGVLREEAEQSNPRQNERRYGDDPVVLAFGPPSERAGDARGGLVLSDARLLFLPMRSLIGGFALVTCPLILRRFARDAALAGSTPDGLGREGLAGLKLEDQGCLVASTSSLVHKEAAFLEDVRLNPANSTLVDELAEWLAGKSWNDSDRVFYAPRMVVVSDTLFGFFVRLNLEVRSRVHINDDTGTAAASGPWLEEFIPAEAVLFGLAQGRKTALVMQDPAKAANGGDGPAEADELTPRTAADSLSVLKALVGSSPLLRFGGKSSGGAGRAFFRLIGSHQ